MTTTPDNTPDVPKFLADQKDELDRRLQETGLPTAPTQLAAQASRLTYIQLSEFFDLLSKDLQSKGRELDVSPEAEIRSLYCNK